MLWAVTLRPAVVAGLAFGLAACAALGRPLEQRTTHGPSADEFFILRTLLANGREPTFDERRYWEDQLDEQIGRYLRGHPEAASSLDVSTFRFYRRAAVGMTKGQITILLGTPQVTTTDQAEMEKLARKFWPDLKTRAKEAWSYPLGWSLYFADDRVVDITQYLER
jgi:hypothetical protein